MCLARALLKKSRVVVLDESFSSVDQRSDAQLMEVVKEEFVGCTMLFITHRLDQVLRFDKLLVLQEGRVAEFGAAEELVTNPDGVFFEMLESTLLTI